MQNTTTSLKAWFDTPPRRNRRKAVRWASPDLAAYFWTGATLREHQVSDISSRGVYVVTTERWSAGAVMLLTLQRKELSETNPDRLVAVPSKVVRWGSDGVGLEFLPPESRSHVGWATDIENATHGKRLARFLSKLFTHDMGQFAAGEDTAHSKICNDLEALL